MVLTVVVPDLRFSIRPHFDPSADLALPALAGLLGRASRLAAPATSAEQCVRRLFKADTTSAALLTLAIDDQDAPAGHWLRADPVHLRPDRDRLVLFDASLLAIQQTEADQLVQVLNQLYQQDGFTFFAATPTRWYLLLPTSPDFVSTPLNAAIGRDIGVCLPTGPKAIMWHRLLNELQMALYSHPVNDAREQSGQAAINSVWLWGEGDAPVAGDSLFATVYADDALVQGLAMISNATSHKLGSGFSLPDRVGDTLIYLDALSTTARQGDIHGWRTALEKLDQDWFAPMLSAWRQGKIDKLSFILPGVGENLHATLTSSSRWQFWRRSASIRHVLGEAA